MYSAIYYGDATYRRTKDILNAALDQERLPEVISSLPKQQSFTFFRMPQEFFKFTNEGTQGLPPIL
jgi:hypothetical protein